MWSAYLSTSRPVGTKRPRTVASTSSAAQSCDRASRCCSRNAEYHAFLGFADPDFGVREPLVLERRSIQPDFGSDVLPHFPDGAGESACPAIGDGRVEVPIAGGEQHIEHFFLFDRIADLNRPAREAFALARQFGARERRAVNSVTAGPATHGDDEVTRLRLLERLVVRDQADIAAEHERVAEIPLVETDRSVDGRNPHPIAIIADALDDAPHDAARMQDSRGKILRWGIGRREAEHIRRRDRLGTQAGPHDVANHAPDSRVGTAVRLEGGRMIVRFDLEHQMECVVEVDDPGVVLEHAHAPILFAEIRADLLGRGEDRLAKHVFELPRAAFHRDRRSGRRASCGCNVRSTSERSFRVRYR